MNDSHPFIIEVSIEVCNQIGGIHTVITSKAAAMTAAYGDNYLLVGPLLPVNYDNLFHPLPSWDGPAGTVCSILQEMGVAIQYGHWQIEGNPFVVLLDPYSLKADQQRYIESYISHHHLPAGDPQLDLILNFGRLVELFLTHLKEAVAFEDRIISHFHEYLAASAIPELKRNQVDVSLVFTTHATILGRRLAATDDNFYNNIDSYNWQQEVAKVSPVDSFLIHLERLITQTADVFTAVSRGMIAECTCLLGRQPDVITPNGFNTAPPKEQGVQQPFFRAMIEAAVKKHFFHYYTFDLNNTLFFFTSGRNEFNNKGYDLIIKAMALLNSRLVKDDIDKHVIMFFITNTPEPALNTNPDTNDPWHEETGNYAPGILTHDQSLININSNQLLLNLMLEGLYNDRSDRVKVLYHPAFITEQSPFIPSSYLHFIQGCDLGIFPSKYEPWGYTPHETAVYNIPTVTSNISGFGQFVLNEWPGHKENDLYILNRLDPFPATVHELTDCLYHFVTTERNPAFRIQPSPLVQLTAWAQLIRFYQEAYDLAMAVQS